jgi:hypothetical protein
LQFSKRACRRPTTQKIEEGDKVTIKGDEDVLDSGRGFIGRGLPHLLQGQNPLICYNYGKQNHIAKNCRDPPRQVQDYN